MQAAIQARLRSQGYRLTPQRLAIYNIIQESGNHLSAVEISDLAQRRIPAIDEATVYRTLGFLLRQGIILAAHIGGRQLVYEIAGREHHHLICRNCGATEEIDHQLLEQLYRDFQSSTGYCIDGMHVTFFGLCPNCHKEHNRHDLRTLQAF